MGTPDDGDAFKILFNFHVKLPLQGVDIAWMDQTARGSDRAWADFSTRLQRATNTNQRLVYASSENQNNCVGAARKT